MKKSEILIESIGQVESKYINEYIKSLDNKKRYTWSKIATLAACIVIVISMVLYPTDNVFRYVVKDGIIKDVNSGTSGVVIYLGELERFEEYYYHKGYYEKHLVVKAKKKTSTSYYHDYENTVHIVDPGSDNPFSYQKENIVFYTLSDLYITEIVMSDGLNDEYSIGDKITVVEQYGYRPTEDGDELIKNYGYYWPLMRNDNEYLVFLRTTKDKTIISGGMCDVNDIKEKIYNVWKSEGVFLLDDNIIEKVRNNKLKNDDVYYGPFTELYKPIFDKYLNME